MDIDFLTLEEVLEIHRDQIARYGGTLGVRDVGLLQLAIAMPQSAFGGQYLHTDLFEMAAAYLFHLSQNHPFLDGNKRVSAVAADVFLALNGVELGVSDDEYERTVLSVACGQMSKSALAEFVRANCPSADNDTD